MDWAAAAGGCKIDLARIRPGIGDELGQRLGVDRWVHRENERHANDAGDRSDVAAKIKVEFVVERRIDRACRTDQKQRVAVWGRTCDQLIADIAGGTGPI